MSWILALLTRLSGVKALIADLLRWLFGAWYRGVIATMLLFMIWQWFGMADLRHERDRALVAVSALTDAREQDRANVAKAAAAAELRAQRNLVRVAADYAAKLEESNHVYQAAADRYRLALAGRLRDRGTAAADPGRPGGSALPADATLSAADVQLAGPADLPADPALTRLTVTLSDLERCAEAYARLEGLIAAWQSAATVNVNDHRVNDAGDSDVSESGGGAR